MTAYVLPNIKQQYFDLKGNPLVGGKVYTYAAGTNDFKATYTDATQTVPNPNPVILDARGEAAIYWNGTYGVRIEDANGALVGTADNIEPPKLAEIEAAAESAVESAAVAVASAQSATTSAAEASIDAAQAAASEATATAAATSSATNAASALASAASAADSAVLADGYADAAANSGRVYPSTAAGLSNGVVGTTGLVGGSGGTNGSFALAFTGGGGSNAAGTFTVAGGAVTAIFITFPGFSYTSAPTLSFAASSGLTGASATAVIGVANPVGSSFNLYSASADNAYDVYRVDSGPVATLVKTTPTATNVVNTRITDKDYAGQRPEFFAEIARFTKARTNGTALSGFTATYNAGGLDIVSTQSGRHVVVSTDFNTHALTQSWEVTANGITINTSSIMVGVAFGPAGATRRQYLYRSNGQVLVVKDDETLDYAIAPAIAGRAYVAGNTVKIKVSRKADGSGVVRITLPNGTVQSFVVSGIPAGPVWLAWRGDGNMHVVQLYQETINADTQAAIDTAAVPELTPAKNATLYASDRLLQKMRVKPPVGFPYQPDFGIYRFSTASFFDDCDFEARRPFQAAAASTTLYVDVATGSDANAGTASDPLKSLYQAAHGRSGNVQIYVKPGVYAGNDSWRDANPTSAGLVVEPWPGFAGRVVSRRNNTGLSWALSSGKTNTYEATITSVGSVVDAANLDADGDYTRLVPVASVDDVEATANSYYVSGLTVYVRTFNNRAPDASLLVFLDARNGCYQRVDGTCWVKGIDFEGGSRPFQVAATTGTYMATGYLWDCSFKYSGGSSGKNGLGTDGHITLYVRDCLGAGNVLDDANYHGVPGSLPPITFEFNCIWRSGGHEPGGTNNGSTMHDGGIIIRVGCLVYLNQNRNIHDVNNAYSWNLGVISRDSRSGINSVNFAAGTGPTADATMMWLDSCTSSGSVYDYETTPEGRIYVYLPQGGNVAKPGSVVTTYTP